jgi:hypothetical protein
VSIPTQGSHAACRLGLTYLVLLIVDHQLGLLQLVKDYTTAEFRNNVLAHAEFGKLFGLPVIMTTSAETGTSGLVYCVRIAKLTT